MPENILSLKDKFDVFLFDIYGVIWNGKEPFAGARELLEELHSSGKKVLLLSNGTQRELEAERKNAERGFVKGVHFDRVVTSGELAYRTFSEDTRSLKYYQFARPNQALFVGSPYQQVETPEDADFVYIGIPQKFENGIWKDFLTVEPFENELKHYLELELPLICANPDIRAHEKQYAEAVVRQGAIARCYEDMGGDVEYFGKPYPLVFDFALEGIEVDDERILMIGDTLETDILGGNSYGVKTALLLTGISEENMRAEGFEDMEEYCRELKIIPDYIVSKLR